MNSDLAGPKKLNLANLKGTKKDSQSHKKSEHKMCDKTIIQRVPKKNPNVIN